MQANNNQQIYTTPLVSIIIPTYNKANFIQETLLSIISQKYKNWEALVIDDGSSDNSTEIIKNLAEKEARIKFFKRKETPKGGSTCRNIGIKNAKGDYMFFFDSDDLMAPDCIEERVSCMQQNPEMDFAIFPVGTFFETIGDNQMTWLPKKGNHLKKFLSHELPWNIMSPIWKAEFVRKKIGGFDKSFPRLQDVEFHTRALLQPDIKYAIKPNYKAQCFYRIDFNRTDQNHFQSLQVMQKGVELYITSFEKEISDIKLRKQLRGTLFSFMTQVNFLQKTKKINHDQYKQLIKTVIQNLETAISVSSIFSFLKIYNQLYQWGLWKIKGFNYLSKLFILFK